MKYILSLLYSAMVLAGCSQKPASQKLVLNPPATMRYNLTLDSRLLKLDIDLACNTERQDGKIIVHSEIKKITYIDGSADEASINRDYQRHIGDRFNSEFDSLGHQLNDPDASAIVNISMLFGEFPPDAVKLSDSWKGKKSAKPDMVFDHMITTYTCESINDSNTVIKTSMDFKQTADKNMQMNITKKYDGNYTVDNLTGTVSSGKFTLTGFSGFSNMKGEVLVKRIQ